MLYVTAATRLGISVKRFLGWEPATVTTVVEWDEEGRPSKWKTESEVEWDAESREEVLALIDHESDLCPNGHPLSESGHPDADPYNFEGTVSYQASNPIVCHACEAQEKARKKWSKVGWYQGKHLLFVVRKVARKPRGRNRQA